MSCTKPLNAILYALEEYPDAGQPKIENISFIVDLISYNQLGTTVFDDRYIRMPCGLVSSYVCSKREDLLPENPEVPDNSCDECTQNHMFRQKKSDLTKFSIYEYYILTKVLTKAGQMDDEELFNYTDSFEISPDTDMNGIVPLRNFSLNSADAEKLKFFGFSNITEEQEFVRDINLFSKEVSQMGRPDKVLVNWKLGELKDKFPEDCKDLFYDIYLAWDEAFRLLIKDYHIFADVLGRQFCENYCIVTNECGSSEYSDIVKYAGEDYHLKLKEICDFLTDENKFSKARKSSDKAFIEIMKSCNNSLHKKYLKRNALSKDTLTY